MSLFLDENYLIGNNEGRTLFSRLRNLPVLDPHNHADVAALAANQPFADLWQLFAATDHYVWELMRKCGVAEEFITGSADSHAKFLALAQAAPLMAGNPVYEWLHLDLRFLGIDELLNAKNGEAIWQAGLAALAQEENLPQNLLRRMNIEMMCSTDDPADTLLAHRELNEQMKAIVVRPTWRPDRVCNINHAGFFAGIKALEERFSCRITNLATLVDALKRSHDYFGEFGCIASDHAIVAMGTEEPDLARAGMVFERKLRNEVISEAEALIYQSTMLDCAARWNADAKRVMQLHIGAVRDKRDLLFKTIGADSGGDVSNHALDVLDGLAAFLNRGDEYKLKSVLYTLAPEMQSTLATVSRAFGSQVRLGAAWWLCDTPIGMKRQLEYIGSVDALSAYAGMVSDSRKLLSYASRFEMFRRVLADVIGQQVEYGQIPAEVAGELVERICYQGVKEFWLES